MAILFNNRFGVIVLTEAVDWSYPFLRSAYQIYVILSHSGRFGRISCLFSITESQFP